MIDPAGKLARNAKLLVKSKGRKRKRRKSGPLLQHEKLMIAEVVHDSPLSTPDDKQIDALSIALRRSPGAIQSVIAQAREKFLANALNYVDLHKQTVDRALLTADYDVARKGSEWAIEHMSSRDADGKVERIVDRSEDSGSSMPAIRIGIALGGLRTRDE